MKRRSEDRIYMMKDEPYYILQSQAKYYDDDEYDHRGYHILFPKKKRENKMIIKPIEK